MAATCSRLGFVARRSLSHHCSPSIRQLWSRTSPNLYNSTVLLSQCSSYSTTTKKDFDTPLSDVEEHKYNRSLFQKFVDWAKSEPEESDDNYIMGEEERRKRDDLLRRVQEMYFSKPPIFPELPFYKEVFETLISYNDRLGVETIWRLMEEMKVEPDDELKTQVDTFLEKARKNAWFE